MLMIYANIMERFSPKYTKAFEQQRLSEQVEFGFDGVYHCYMGVCGNELILKWEREKGYPCVHVPDYYQDCTTTLACCLPEEFYKNGDLHCYTGVFELIRKVAEYYGEDTVGSSSIFYANGRSDLLTECFLDCYPEFV